MMQYKTTKEKVRSPDGGTDFFDIVKSVLKGDTLAPYMFIFYLDCVLRTSIDLMKENGFTLTKARSWKYSTQTITGAVYADDIARLANTPAQAESLLYSLDRAASGISLHMNANKTRLMCFNQRGNISALNAWSLKLVDKFT